MKLQNKKMSVLCAFALVVSAASYGAPSSPMHFSHITLEDGLTQNNVQSILQDSTGYMWFATENGLNRYDGYEVHQYFRERDNNNGLANDFIWVVAEDSDQNIWLATQGSGIVRWNRATDSFTAFRHDPSDPDSLASDDIRTLLLNADGTVWVGTRDQGVDLFDPRTGVAQHFRYDPRNARSLSNNTVYALHVDSQGHLWVGTDGGVNRMAANFGAFERFSHDARIADSLSDNMIRTIFEDHSGRLWIGTFSGGLNEFDRQTGGFAQLRHDPEDPSSLSNDHVRTVFEDDENRLWIGTANGLNLLDVNTGTVDRYLHDPANPQSLNDSYVNSMFQDRSGLLWVGTRSAGVSKWNPKSWALGHYIQPWLSGEDITSFASDGNGRLWLGTLGAGLASIDEQSGEVQRYRHDPNRTNSISDDAVMSLLLDSAGNLWIGTMSSGLMRMSTSTGAIESFRHDAADPASLAADGVMDIYEDDLHRLWIGTYGGGVSVLDTNTGEFRNYRHDSADPRSLSSARASAILDDKKGSMWIGTFGGGLNRLDLTSGEIQSFQHDADDPASLADNMIYALHMDNNGNIWVGSAGGGLDLIESVTDGSDDIRFRNFSQLDGLPNNVINGIQSDTSNLLWLSTNYGLTRFDPSTREIKTFHRGHGLQGEEFNFAAHHRGPDGKLYFGGANGFNAIDSDGIDESVHSPTVVLTSFQKLNEPVSLDAPYDRLKEIKLGYRDDLVNLSFAALDFAAPERNTYTYTLEGFDSGWNDLGTTRRITYTDLDAGNYELKVRARTSDGVPSANEISIPVFVSPAPWANAWAYTGYTAILILLLWLAWRLHQNRLEREAEYSSRLEEEVALRTEELAERNLELQVASQAKGDFLARMSHEIRTPMNGMLGMTHLLMGTELDDKQNRFARTIKRSAESLLDIINDILDFSKIEAGRLELDNVEFDVSELVDDSIELFSGAAYEKGIELICSTPPGKSIYASGDPMRLKQVLVNLIGNAIKFTQDGNIILRYMLVNDDSENLTFRFEVADSGVGIKPENMKKIFDSFSQEDGSTSRRFGGTGLGLAICRQIIEMMGGKIGVESVPGQGSCFWFNVTLQKATRAWFSRNVSNRLANLNVLLIDDNVANAEIVMSYLSALGVQATHQQSGYDGLKRLNMSAESSPFDVVLVDTRAGEMTGLEVAEAITDNPAVQGVKILMMSSAAADLDEAQWRDAGIDDCLPKPVRQSALYESLIMLTKSAAVQSRTTKLQDKQPNKIESLTGSVLLVEDNPVNQAVALGMLEELGCDTVVAINGLEAIDHASKREFDVVLMDCEMPVMDGFTATAAIRDRATVAGNVPIIALTANAVDGDRERCIAAGMQDYLSKPVTVEKLHGTLSKWLPADGDSLSVEGLDPIDVTSLDSIRNLQGVGGDRMVGRVVDLYLSNSSMLVEDLRIGLSKGDAEAVRQGAHALKSSSQNVGACGVATLSQQLEEMGRSGKLGHANSCMCELEKLYPKTVIALKAAVQRVN
ncbi:MAG: two-component regulator propeller domain-containing protein [Woeseiaceae bacterium]